MAREVLQVQVGAASPAPGPQETEDEAPTRTTWQQEPPAPPVSTVQRLRLPMPTDRLLSWIVTAVIASIAFAIRIVHLATPANLVFDETYYAKDAYSLLKFGYERAWPDDANASIVAGNVNVMTGDPSFIVHPQLGKWLIALGEQVFGMNSFGWRISSTICGCIMIAILIRLVRRVSRSTLIGGVAGLLLTFDGLHFVMSRIALLDIFMACFVVAAVACLAADRDWFRDRLARHLLQTGASDLAGTFGPVWWLRPWRIAAGVCFGLALGSKWNALYILAAFALLSLAWDIGARRLAGAGDSAGWALIKDGIPAFISLVVLALGVYLATWSSWLATSGGWDRQWGAEHPEALSTRLLGAPLASLLQYHHEIWDFHTGDFINHATHPYAANPLGWLIVARPIGIDAVNDIAPGTKGCTGPDNCLQVISGLGTPLLWWGAVIALVVALLLWIGGRDWRFGIPIAGVLSAWLPWFQYTSRPLFFFYAIAIIPFSVMAVALCLGRLLGPRTGRHRMAGAIIGGAFVALVGANFAYIYPILTDQVLPYPQWLARMWFKSWI